MRLTRLPNNIITALLFLFSYSLSSLSYSDVFDAEVAGFGTTTVPEQGLPTEAYCSIKNRSSSGNEDGGGQAIFDILVEVFDDTGRRVVEKKIDNVLFLLNGFTALDVVFTPSSYGTFTIRCTVADIHGAPAFEADHIFDSDEGTFTVYRQQNLLIPYFVFREPGSSYNYEFDCSREYGVPGQKDYIFVVEGNDGDGWSDIARLSCELDRNDSSTAYGSGNRSAIADFSIIRVCFDGDDRQPGDNCVSISREIEDDPVDLQINDLTLSQREDEVLVEFECTQLNGSASTTEYELKYYAYLDDRWSKIDANSTCKLDRGDTDFERIYVPIADLITENNYESVQLKVCIESASEESNPENNCDEDTLRLDYSKPTITNARPANEPIVSESDWTIIVTDSIYLTSVGIEYSMRVGNGLWETWTPTVTQRRISNQRIEHIITVDDDTISDSIVSYRAIVQAYNIEGESASDAFILTSAIGLFKGLQAQLNQLETERDGIAREIDSLLARFGDLPPDSFASEESAFVALMTALDATVPSVNYSDVACQLPDRTIGLPSFTTNFGDEHFQIMRMPLSPMYRDCPGWIVSDWPAEAYLRYELTEDITLAATVLVGNQEQFDAMSYLYYSAFRLNAYAYLTGTLEGFVLCETTVLAPINCSTSLKSRMYAALVQALGEEGIELTEEDLVLVEGIAAELSLDMVPGISSGQSIANMWLGETVFTQSEISYTAETINILLDLGSAFGGTTYVPARLAKITEKLRSITSRLSSAVTTPLSTLAKRTHTYFIASKLRRVEKSQEHTWDFTFDLTLPKYNFEVNNVRSFKNGGSYPVQAVSTMRINVKDSDTVFTHSIDFRREDGVIDFSQGRKKLKAIATPCTTPPCNTRKMKSGSDLSKWDCPDGYDRSHLAAARFRAPHSSMNLICLPRYENQTTMRLNFEDCIDNLTKMGLSVPFEVSIKPGHGKEQLVPQFKGSKEVLNTYTLADVEMVLEIPQEAPDEIFTRFGRSRSQPKVTGPFEAGFCATIH